MQVGQALIVKRLSFGRRGGNLFVYFADASAQGNRTNQNFTRYRACWRMRSMVGSLRRCSAGGGPENAREYASANKNQRFTAQLMAQNLHPLLNHNSAKSYSDESYLANFDGTSIVTGFEALWMALWTQYREPYRICSGRRR